MNVLYLHQYFATRGGAAGTRSYEFAQFLLKHGHAVTMITGLRQGGGIEGRGHQIVDGIDVISLGGWYSNRLGRFRRIMQFLRFTLRASMVRPSSLPRRPDVVIATSTPLTIGIPGVLLARRLKVPFVFEVRDLWPRAPIELGALRGRLPIALATRLERWIYRNSTRIIALSPGMERGVIEAGVDPAIVSMIPNASDIDLFGPDHRDRSLLARWGLEHAFVAVHAGSMGAANGLDYLIDAARVLAERGESDIAIMICGDGGTRPRLEQRARDLGLDNIVFAGSIPRQELGAIVSSCDVSITSFADVPVLATNSPNKFFDGLAAGRPVIVNSAGWTKDIVESSEAGCWVDVQHPDQLADALIERHRDPELCEREGIAARHLAETTYERLTLAAQFESVLADAADRVATPA